MLGIGGTGMGALAGLLTEAGHQVTGTDEKIYPPMSDQLEKLGITPFEGYAASNLSTAKPELVIIGNVIRRINPEAQEVMRLGLEYRSMPETLSEFFLKDRIPLIITGTHGKTSSATLAAWLLEAAGHKPGFLIGGVGLNFGKSYSVGAGPFFVVEGDEYDTAFFDKGPKFLHYRPQALLITSIEFDHADIYKDLDQIMESFRRLVAIVPPEGLIVVNADDKNALSVTAKAKCRVVHYGIDSGQYRPEAIKVAADGTSFSISGFAPRFTLPMWGLHNLSNTVGVIATLIESFVAPEKIAAAIAAFKGVRRRQELAGDIKGVSVIDDFAHHPTAVQKTIESMRLRFPGRRLWAVFEPRSNTSRRNFFQDEFALSLSKADRVIIGSPYRAETIPKAQRLDPDAVAAKIAKMGGDAHHIEDTEHIVEFIMRGLIGGDCILVMSNGRFDGLVGKLLDALKKRRIYSNNDKIAPSHVPSRDASK